MHFDFDPDDRPAIERALADSNPNNPLALALATRIREFSNNLAQMAERNGHWPSELLLYRPQTAFDDIVIRLTLETIANQLHHHITIHWLPAEQTPPAL